MTPGDDGYEVLPFPLMRRVVIDSARIGSRAVAALPGYDIGKTNTAKECQPHPRTGSVCQEVRSWQRTRCAKRS